MPKIKVTIRSEVKLRLKSGLSNNLKTTQGNFKKLHRKIKHNEKVCHELGSHIQDQGHSQVSEVKSYLFKYFKLAETNFIKLIKLKP